MTVTDECAVWCLICGGYGLSWTSQRVFTGEESATISYVHSHRSICLVSEAAGLLCLREMTVLLIEWEQQCSHMIVHQQSKMCTAVLMTHSTWVDVMNAALAQIRAQNLWNTELMQCTSVWYSESDTMCNTWNAIWMYEEWHVNDLLTVQNNRIKVIRRVRKREHEHATDAGRSVDRSVQCAYSHVILKQQYNESVLERQMSQCTQV